ncbi:MAG: DUF1611 domain-containing protein, partial [Candidatus Bathyarchaeia archaeon]
RDAGEVLGIGPRGIPVVGSLQDALRYDPEVLVIGIAPPGGRLPPTLRRTIREALERGMDVISGLHYFLSEDEEFAEEARKRGRRIWDVRKPPANLRVLTGQVRSVPVPIVTILSTDITSGKNIAVIEMLKEAERRGLSAGFIATGQTTMIIGADAGATIDAIPGDFMAGEVERMILDVAEKKKDLILVEGQGALSHPAFGNETLAILYGSWPDAIVLCHDPFRTSRDRFPQFALSDPRREIKMLETVFPEARVVAIAVDGYQQTTEDVQKTCDKLERETQLPCTDPYRFGAAKLLDAVLAHVNPKHQKA